MVTSLKESLWVELDELLKVIEAFLPANPQAAENDKLTKPVEKDLRDYFRTLEQAFPYSDVLAIFGPIVATQGGQTESRGSHKAEKPGSIPSPATIMEADPWDEPIGLLINAFSKQIQSRLTGRLLNIYLTGSAQMIEWGRTKTTDRPIFNEGPPMRQAFEYADARCARLVTQMDTETKNRLAKVVGDSIRDKEGIPNLARNIRNEFSDMTKYRSETIARTETADALEQSFMDRSHDIGVTGKRWITTDPCDVCMANGNLGTVPLDEAPYMDVWGGSIERPPAHPRCRCALAPVMLEEG